MKNYRSRRAVVDALNALDRFDGEGYSAELNDAIWAAYDLLDNALYMLELEDAAAEEDVGEDDTDEEDF